MDNKLDALASSASQPPSAKEAKQRASVMDAIDQMFAEFELVFHNQYQKAFTSNEKLMYAKKLWFNNLKDYSAELILKAAHRAVREAEFLPTVRGILKYLENAFDMFGLPDPHRAYLEACRASSPKAEYQWSHPAVYFAGLETDWFFLANNPEHITFKIFERNYRILCDRVLKGEELKVPIPKGIEQGSAPALSKTVQKEHLKKLREETGL